MLTLKISTDKDSADNLEKKIFSGCLNNGERVILFNEDYPCGIAVFRLNENGVFLDRAGILPQFRNQHIGDFFLRSLLFKFTFYDMNVHIGWVHQYFNKFGFVRRDMQMVAYSKEIVFPSACKGGEL